MRSLIYNLLSFNKIDSIGETISHIFFNRTSGLIPSPYIFFGYRARCIASYAINCAQSKLSFRFFPLARDHFSSPGFEYIRLRVSQFGSSVAFGREKDRISWETRNRCLKVTMLNDVFYQLFKRFFRLEGSEVRSLEKLANF